MEETPKKKNPHAVALAKLGARKGGLARAASLSPRKRTELARKAVNVRWERYRAAQQIAEMAASHLETLPRKERLKKLDQFVEFVGREAQAKCRRKKGAR